MSLVVPRGGEMCDAALAGGQRVDPAQQDGAWVGAGGCELLVAALHERGRTAPLGVVDAFAQQLPRLAAVVVATQRCTEVHERARMLEPCGRGRKHIDRLPQQPLPGLAALDQPERTQ